MFYTRAGSPSDLLARPSSPVTVSNRCQECQLRGTNWCYQCNEAHCDECARYHAIKTTSGAQRSNRILDTVKQRESSDTESLKCCKTFVEGMTLFCKRCKRSYCAFCAIEDHCKCGGSSVLIPSFSDIQKLKEHRVCDKRFSKSVSEFRTNHKQHGAPTAWMELADRPGEVTLFSLSQKRKPGQPEKLPVPRCRIDMLARLETSSKSVKNWINSMDMLSDGSLLFVQLYLSELKHVTPTGVILASCSFYTNPWAVTCIDDSLAAVTLPERKHIQLVRIKSGALHLGRRIVTKHKCLGICSTGSRLVTTCWQGCIHVMSLQGDEYLAINKNVQGERLFRNPEYITTNPERTLVYVTDFKKHTLTALKFEGNSVNKAPVFVFSDPNLKGPKGVSVDGSGFIYIAGMTSKNIFKLTPEGKKVQIFRRKHDSELYEELCVSPSGNLVYVSVFEGDVLVFSLTSNDLCQACEIFKRIN